MSLRPKPGASIFQILSVLPFLSSAIFNNLWPLSKAGSGGEEAFPTLGADSGALSWKNVKKLKLETAYPNSRQCEELVAIFLRP